MVSPVYLLVFPLASAFLLTLTDKASHNLSLTIFYAALIASAALSFSWFYQTAILGQNALVYTAGAAPPLSIALQLGETEAFFLSAASIIALLTAVVMYRKFSTDSPLAMVLYLMVLLGAAGLILTTDLFNMFVFLEILSLSTAALIALEQNTKSLSSGFKYMIAAGIASAFFLIGVAYVYRLTGSLAIPDIAESKELFSSIPGLAAIFLVVSALLIELKPFPANGWALDVYQTADGGISALISSVNGTAVLYALMKLFPVLPQNLITVIGWVGILTFFFSNFIGLKQSSVKRLLGYSSAAQIGLVVSIISFGTIHNFSPLTLILTAGAVFLGHLFAKAGLFWISRNTENDTPKNWEGPAGAAGLTLFGILAAALAGFPPFPAFFAKWTLLQELIGSMPVFSVLLLTGSLFEAVYLFRWFGLTASLRLKECRSESSSHTTVYFGFRLSAAAFFPLWISAIALTGIGLVTAAIMGFFTMAVFFPIAAGLAVLLSGWKGNRFSGIIGIILSGLFAFLFYPNIAEINIPGLGWATAAGNGLDSEIIGIAAGQSSAENGLSAFRHFFFLLFSVGGILTFIGALHKRTGINALYPLLTVLIISLQALTVSSGLFSFFFLWEVITISSYILLLLNKEAQKPALRYLTFSLTGAFILMAGLTLIGFYFPQGSGFTAFADMLAETAPGSGMHVIGIIAFILAAIGFLIKIGAAGVHIWLPEAYAEADDTVSPLFSGILSKAGIFGLFLFAPLLLSVGNAAGFAGIPAIAVSAALRWIGIITAITGSLLAVFQEDIKKLLAYSSMGQLGYIVLAFGIMSNLGWATGLYLTFLHLCFKTILFLAAAGIILRTGTRYMYQMGGLIKRMPISFIAVLISIISVSGVPPLAGFGGKWMLYTALIEGGHYLLAGLAFFSGTIAFLYLFRLIHAIFLGQLKTRHRQVREAPVLLMLPQVLLLFAIMAVSSFPALLIKPVTAIAGAVFPAAVHWEGYTVISSLGYFNGVAVMTVTMVVFGLILIWLALVQRKTKMVKQFNIVYAGERPERPETTHFAYNFFAPYKKALGFLAEPRIHRFWAGITESAEALGGALRRIYTGNGQTYALHIILFVSVLYVIAGRL